jgi:hypothetical protein
MICLSPLLSQEREYWGEVKKNTSSPEVKADQDNSFLPEGDGIQ